MLISVLRALHNVFGSKAGGAAFSQALSLAAELAKWKKDSASAGVPLAGNQEFGADLELALESDFLLEESPASLGVATSTLPRGLLPPCCR